MANIRFTNPTDLHEHVEAAARAAVLEESPEVSFSLHHISDDADMWEDVFRTAFLSVLPLHATLSGCLQALRSHSVGADRVGDINGSPKAVEIEADRAMARQWLAAALQSDLDGDQQQLMIVDYVIARGWETHSTRLPSLMLSLVEMAHASINQAGSG